MMQEINTNLLPDGSFKSRANEKSLDVLWTYELWQIKATLKKKAWRGSTGRLFNPTVESSGEEQGSSKYSAHGDRGQRAKVKLRSCR